MVYVSAPLHAFVFTYSPKHAQTLTWHRWGCGYGMLGSSYASKTIRNESTKQSSAIWTVTFQPRCPLRVTRSAWPSTPSWKNRFEELDHSCTTTLCVCVCMCVCVDCFYTSVSLHMHICSRASLFNPPPIVRVWPSVAVVTAADMWAVFCAWAVCVWHSSPIQNPSRCRSTRLFLLLMQHVNKQAGPRLVAEVPQARESTGKVTPPTGIIRACAKRKPSDGWIRFT